MKVTIDKRYCGPPASGNGGYVCGLLAQNLRGTVDVALRAPPPLGTPLDLDLVGDRALLRMGTALIGEAKVVADDDALGLPAMPTYEAALAAASHYDGHRHHEYPSCFVCGTQRAEGDGLRLFTGRLESGVVAAPWCPSFSHADASGSVPAPLIWATIDCAGYWAAVEGLAERPGMLLGRMVGRVDGTVSIGEKCVVIGWRIGSEGRKHYAGTALYDSQGRCVGRTRQTWIALRTEA